MFFSELWVVELIVYGVDVDGGDVDDARDAQVAKLPREIATDLDQPARVQVQYRQLGSHLIQWGSKTFEMTVFENLLKSFWQISKVFD